MSRQDVRGSEELGSEGVGKHSDSFSSKTSNSIKKMAEKLFVEDLIFMPAFCVIFFPYFVQDVHKIAHCEIIL